MKEEIVSIIMAGGKGTRMGSTTKHKVCFEISGTPAINRAIETYNLCGVKRHCIVVGYRAGQVIETVGSRFSNVFFVYQDQPRGTGHAVSIAARCLEDSAFRGSVLVVAGDKVIQPRILNQLFKTFRERRCDLAFVVGPREMSADSGLIVYGENGQVIADVEIKELAKARASQQSFTFASGQSFSADDIDRRCHHANLSVYLFKAEALYEGLKKIPPATPQREQYFTDIIEALAADPKRIVEAVPVRNATEVMAFNNPQELLQIQDYYRRLHCEIPREVAAERPPLTMATAAQWEKAFQQQSPKLAHEFEQIYGEWPDPARFIQLARGFAERFGSRAKFAILRSPGRVNLMGRHIDHQGGETNLMAIDREVLMAVAPRADDLVRLVNHNNRQFDNRTFRISDEVARLDWDDWLSVINGPALRRMLADAAGDWANYVKAAVFRLQEQFRDRKLYGMDIFVDGNIPMAAGLSSSSALVVAAAEAVVSFNRLPVAPHQLVDLCGEGEWFVGTRGGAGDHAAIKLSQKGIVTHIGFFPFRVIQTAPFFRDCALIICNSGDSAHKSGAAKTIFNQRVACYHIGRVMIRMLFPHYAPLIQHLRDVNVVNLGCSSADIYRIVSRLPARLDAVGVREMLKSAAEEDRDALEIRLSAFTDPHTAFHVRDVCLYGLAEMARSKEAIRFLEANDPIAFGQLMNISHDGDRVAAPDGKPYDGCLSDADYLRFVAEAEKYPLHLQPGAYACSTKTIDRIVDTVKTMNGVFGAQLAGAGLGGCAMVLTRSDAASAVISTLETMGFESDVMRPVQGAGPIQLR